MRAALRNGLFYGLGFAALGLACLRHRVGGYRRPTEFSPSDWPRSVAHVVAIVEDWRHHLCAGDGRPLDIRDRDVLELGPGATLGTGVLLMGLGARSYRAVDAFPLAGRAPAGFYRALAEAELPAAYDRARIRSALEAIERGEPEPVSYVADPGFDVVRAAQGRGFDLVVSNAAFEHFEDVAATLAQVTAVARPGAAFLAAVDFQTHSRGVRSLDPNSIYRFSPGLYRVLAFPGQPNRWRPEDYRRALLGLGWRDAEIRPVDVADAAYLDWSRPGLWADFGQVNSAMDVLTGIVFAEKRSAPRDDPQKV